MEVGDISASAASGGLGINLTATSYYDPKCGMYDRHYWEVRRKLANGILWGKACPMNTNWISFQGPRVGAVVV